MIDKNEAFSAARQDFVAHFGSFEEPNVREDFFAGEQVIVVENSSKRAFYSSRIELLKVINLKGEME